jgi:quaternary ammonium compound-resistance protein SugE
MKYWIALVLAASVEVLWMFSLKYIDIQGVREFFSKSKYTSLLEYRIFLAPAGYVIFGLTNVALFSWSMKGIPAAIAFASWMGLTLILTLLVETLLLKTSSDWRQLLFISLILVGIIGLKMTTPAN